MTVTKWLLIDYTVKNHWVVPIWTAVNRAAENEHVDRLSDELRQLGLHVSTRLSMIETLIQRINGFANRLSDRIEDREPHHEFTAAKDGYVFPLLADFMYAFLIDLDALLFELNSCCELMIDLFQKLYEHAGRTLPRNPVGLVVRDVLEAAGQDASWFVRLDGHRNFFMHHGAPFFAVDLSNTDSGKHDLLVMKRNLRSFEDESQFVRYSELRQIVGGFQHSIPVIQHHLVALFS